MDLFLSRVQSWKEGTLDLEKEETQRALLEESNADKSKSKSPRKMVPPSAISARRMGARSPRKKLKMNNEVILLDAKENEQEYVDIESFESIEEEEEEEEEELHELGTDDEEEERENKIRKKRTTRQLEPEETKILEDTFISLNGVLDKVTKQNLANQLKWNAQGVYNWFRRKNRSMPPPKKVIETSTSNSQLVVNALSPEMSQIAKKIVISSPYAQSVAPQYKRPVPQQRPKVVSTIPAIAKVPSITDSQDNVLTSSTPI